MKAAPIIAIIIFVILVIIFVFVSLGKQQQMVVVSEGNHDRIPIEMVVGHFQGSECGMVINDLRFASQVIAPDGKTWFFDDHGCMAAWLKGKAFEAEAIVWVKELNTETWIDGRAAWYSQTDQTPMSYGFGAYKAYVDSLIDFNTMQEHMLRGETMANLTYRQQILGK